MSPQEEDLRPAGRPARAIVLTWLVASIVLLALTSTRILASQTPDVDDVLRLVQVRDLLAGQGWFDLYQHRMNPPEGTLMHWSRLVDVPIAGLILLLSQFVSMARAEQVTMIAIPLLLLLLTMLAVGLLAHSRFGTKVAIISCAALILMPVVPAQFQPLRIDHHGWQILTVALALWAISWRSPAHGGIVAGLAMAIGLMISLETIFMAAGFGLVLTWRWLRDHHERRWLVAYLLSLASGLLTVFLLTRGLPDLATHCDAISPPHLGLFLIVALGSAGLAAVPSPSRFMVLGALATFGAAGIAFVGWNAPQCLAPPFSGLDPLVRDYWYLNVTEGLPVWHQKMTEAIPALVQPLFAIIVTFFLATSSRAEARNWWREYALLLVTAFVGGVLTYRSMAFPGMIAAVPIGWFAARMIERWQRAEHLWTKLGIALACYGIFLPGAPLALFQQSSAAEPSSHHDAIASATCQVNKAAPRLDQFPKATLFAPLDIGPALLAHTHHSVVASSHHRSEKAMRDVIYGFVHEPQEARKVILAHGAQYVVACMSLPEFVNFSGGNKQGLAALLANGTPPAWLEPVDLASKAGLKVWRVLPDDQPVEASSVPNTRPAQK